MKFYLFLFCFIPIIYAQSDFWSHYSLDYPIRQLVETPDGLIFAVSDSTILKSSDYGATWAKIFEDPIPPNYSFRLEINTNSFSSYTLIVSSRMYQNFTTQISTNGGSNWQTLSFPGNFRDIAINSLGDIFLLSDTLYKSTNNGLNWIEMLTPSDYMMGVHIAVDKNDNLFLNRGKRFFIIENGIIIYTWWEDKIFRFSESTQDWQYLFYVWDLDQIKEMFIVPDENLFLNFSYKYQTHHFRNGSNKIYPSNNINGAIFEGDIIKYISDNQGIAFTPDNSQTNWISVNSGLPGAGAYSILRDSLGYLYTGTVNGIYKSNFTSFWLTSHFIYSFSDTRVGDTTYKSIVLTNPFPFDLYIDSILCSSESFIISSITDSLISPNSSVNLFIGFNPKTPGDFTNDVSIYTHDVFFEFKTYGTSPIPTIINIPYTNFDPVAIGDTSSLSISFTSQSLNKIVIDSANLKLGDNYFIEDLNFPLEIETDDTLNLKLFFVPLSIGFKIDTLIIVSNSTNSPLELRLMGQGQHPTEIIDDEEELISFELLNCYPNPFNPLTTIEYAVPKRSIVKISIFNTLGEEIDILLNEEKDKGNYKIEFFAHELASGVYFYKMQADNFIATKKFILLK